MEHILAVCFLFVTLILTVYGANALVLTLYFIWLRFSTKPPDAKPVKPPQTCPEITIQLPVYNECASVRRVIDSAARIDYPVNRLTIQVLDDSTDDTTRVAEERVEYWRAQGKNISLVHRADRSEYKAGNLKHGMALDHSEFLAVFDADFHPAPDWLKQAMEPFFGEDGASIGLVQTRWSHMNETHSPLTRVQAMLLDGHFGIEQCVRSDAGWFSSFNGSGGVWRRRCIEESGGWRGDTLSEDLDLSFRAQLGGWKFRYLPAVCAAAELPTTVSAFKIQQFRWAKGCMQAMLLHAPKITQAPVSPWKKIQGLIQISGFIIHALLVLLVLLSLPLALAGSPALRGLPMAILGFGAAGGPLMIAAGVWNLHPEKGWWKRLLWMPVLVLLATGVAVSNSKAVITGLLNIYSPFQRTPKPSDAPAGNATLREIRKTVRVDSITWWEIGLAAYALAAVVIDLRNGNLANAAYFLVYAAGFAWVGVSALLEAYSPLFEKKLSSKKLDARPD
jgi:cellulose synthase/poly-beta-1,6-N-acetylglucosamine synthase-like glycosyltransferase